MSDDKTERQAFRLSRVDPDINDPEYLKSPSEWLDKHRLNTNPAYLVGVLLGGQHRWTPADVMIHAALLLDMFVASKMKVLDEVIEAVKTTEMSLDDTPTPELLEKNQLTIAARGSKAFRCPKHLSIQVQAGTACPECVEEAVTRRPEGLSEEEARKTLAETIETALNEIQAGRILPDESPAEPVVH